MPIVVRPRPKRAKKGQGKVRAPKRSSRGVLTAAEQKARDDFREMNRIVKKLHAEGQKGSAARETAAIATYGKYNPTPKRTGADYVLHKTSIVAKHAVEREGGSPQLASKAGAAARQAVISVIAEDRAMKTKALRNVRAHAMRGMGRGGKGSRKSSGGKVLRGAALTAHERKLARGGAPVKTEDTAYPWYSVE